MDKIGDFVAKNRVPAFIGVVFFQAVLSNYFAFALRFNTLNPSAYKGGFLQYLPLILASRVVLNLRLGLHKGLWRYASINDMLKILQTSTAGSLFFFAAVRYWDGNTAYPVSVYVLDWLLFVTLSAGFRFLIRVLRERVNPEAPSKKVFIVGAGDSAELLVRDMVNNPGYGYLPLGLVDNDPYKKGLTINGIPILGTLPDLPALIKKMSPDEILISTDPKDSPKAREVFDLCKGYDIPIKKLPLLTDLLNGNLKISSKLGQFMVEKDVITSGQLKKALQIQLRDGGRLGEIFINEGYITSEELVSNLQQKSMLSQMKPLCLEDLLQREPIRTDIESISKYLEGRTVLVTGAGGSIGSELCRQIARYHPSELILLDRYENNLFHVDRELKRSAARTRILPVIADVQDFRYLDYIFSKSRPSIVFHAAAYKHVPMMEGNPFEAVKNNVFGTKNVLEVSASCGAASFVTISTDKAVNPTSVMGATKRISEFLTLKMNGLSITKFMAVRFGNVMDTNGSVLPVFREQLKRGGPLTVTHPEMRRFFMLIPEAIQLVLIAAAAGSGGEIFVLDMGEPVKIMDLAENVIRLSGLVPHKEIKIVISGLRPGEKLFEELIDSSEKVTGSFHDKLKIAIPQAMAPDGLDQAIADMARHLKSFSAEGLLSVLGQIVPNFRKGGRWQDDLVETEVAVSGTAHR
ncbi:MAG: polysaccharide biosynthesis protein [Nitrospiraceae bacterium]|nr:polysaccharide biosynthesis protein [Nitrospiraceae bacterium]